MSDNLCAVCGQAPRNPLANVCQSCSDEIERRQARHTCPACEAAARERDDLHALCDRQADILSRVAVALRGPEPPLTRWSHHDLPERVEMIMRDHICEECGETIPLEHPCNCQRCWNEQVGMYVDLRARLEVLADELAARQWPRTSDASAAAEQIADELRAELRKEAK